MRLLGGCSVLGLLVAGFGVGGCGANASNAPADLGTAGTPPGSGTGNTGNSTGGSSGVVVGNGGNGGVSCTSPNGCKAQVPEGCGDGINNQGGIEQCDDGNTVPGDGCNGACKVEPNWNCPTAGPCTKAVVCGDSQVGPGEVCDDGNQVDGDGCNSTCTYQDPAYTCVPGQACVKQRACGNGRIETGENCDDGNTNSGDGCSSTCVVESGFTCPIPKQPCKPAPRCGDGVVNANLGEVCDDGNTADGDGCSSDCKTKQTGCICKPGSLCQCPVVACGNGKLEGTEACDDGNTRGNDGCSANCTIETGYDCPFTNAPCVPKCGDGIVLAPMEQCDPGVSATNMAQACSSTCRWNPGWACSGSSCHQTKCGDKVKEGAEACDDGNTTPGDGCSPTCRIEPSCSIANGTCTSTCGDGVVMPAQPDGPVMPGGACDDGNTNNGDGCASSCTVEPGYQCQQASMAQTPSMTVPVWYRDFRFGGDFEPSATGQNVAVTGLVSQTLDSEGKPVFAGTNGQGYITSGASFANWYRDVSGTNSTYKSTMTLYNNGNGGFVNRWGPNGEQWSGYANARWCSDATCGNCNAPAYVAGPTTACLTPCTPWGTGNTNSCAVDLVKYDGNPVFFPVDNIAGMVTPTSEYKAATIPPAYGGTYNAEPGGALHNFSFTSEVRYWFGYVASKQYILDFTGDDDVWVFINRRLAVDLGGIHTAVNGRIQLDANGGGTVTITQTEPNPPPASIVRTVSLGMTSGGVYEIAVFQAERQTTASTYKLTLSGFNDAASECKPQCGDGVVSPGEQCDNGSQNLGGYNQCTSDCRLGPYCGDNIVTSPNEACDNGVNDTQYGSTNGCGPDCQLPARCGDGKVQVDYGESCDDGVNDGSYGHCSRDCQTGPFCGDGAVNGPERCDDGANDGTYGTCGDPTKTLPNCDPAPKCGDNILQPDYGEQCEPKSWDSSIPPKSTDPDCTSTCRKPQTCGNAVVESPEQCDDGVNDGSYGGCAPSCIWAPHCGDGVKNGPEECDDGTNDGTYGGCTSTCKLASHCGDGHTDAPYEECDNGANNGTDDICSTACKKIIYIPN
jgi:fibro-slime domain-containing protein